MSALKLLAAIALVVSPASLGIAAYTGAVDLDPTASSEPEFNGEVVWEETGTFDQAVTTGTLDLRVDRGAVRAIGWDKPAYRIVVVEAPHEDAEASDHETVIEFEDNSSGDAIDLKLIADRQGTYRVQQDDDGARTGGHVDLAIIAWVPASADYKKVRACSGQDSFWSGAIATVDEVLGEVAEVRHGESACVPAEETPGSMAHVSIQHNANDTGLNVTSGVVGLHGGLLRAFTEFGSIEVTDASFENIHLTSGYGSIGLTEVTADDVAAATGYGGVSAEGLETAELNLASDYGDLEILGTAEEVGIATDYGDILLDGTFDRMDATTDYGNIHGALDVRASGSHVIATEYGDVELSVPAQDAIGYDVVASTEYGDVDIDLEDASRQGDTGDEEDHEAEEQHVRTRGYDDRAIQIEVLVETEYGDVEISHQDVDLAEDEGDGDDGGTREGTPVSPVDRQVGEITHGLR